MKTERQEYMAFLDAYTLNSKKSWVDFRRPLNNQSERCHGVDGRPRRVVDDDAQGYAWAFI